MKIWLISFLNKIPYIIWSGAIERKDRSESFLRKIQRKILVKRAAGFIAYGTKAKQYLLSLGADIKKIQIGINTVDTKFYRSETETLRNNLKLPDDKKHLLYIGSLSSRKNVIRVLKVINKLSKLRTDFILDIVGDGEDRKGLGKYVIDNRLQGGVSFHGFKQKKDIPQFMAQADCFLFQTDYDIWGLVLVEAMAAGVPCIASTNAGATYDLIKDGETGFAIDFSETEKVAERIHWILNNPELSQKISRNASNFIEINANITRSAEGFTKAILKVFKYI